jgi:hypothetical protein
MLDENVEFLVDVCSETPGLQNLQEKILALEPDTTVLERNQQSHFVLATERTFPKREYILKPHPCP